MTLDGWPISFWSHAQTSTCVLVGDDSLGRNTRPQRNAVVLRDASRGAAVTRMPHGAIAAQELRSEDPKQKLLLQMRELQMTMELTQFIGNSESNAG